MAVGKLISLPLDIQWVLIRSDALFLLVFTYFQSCSIVSSEARYYCMINQTIADPQRTQGWFGKKMA